MRTLSTQAAGKSARWLFKNGFRAQKLSLPGFTLVLLLWNIIKSYKPMTSWFQSGTSSDALSFWMNILGVFTWPLRFSSKTHSPVINVWTSNRDSIFLPFQIDILTIGRSNSHLSVLRICWTVLERHDGSWLCHGTHADSQNPPPGAEHRSVCGPKLSGKGRHLYHRRVSHYQA